jgi:hypothetical protein
MTTKVSVIEAPIKAVLGHIIKPGDEIVTFAQINGRGTHICFGIYRGIVQLPNGGVKYAVERTNGKISYLRFNSNIARKTITLAELEGMTI